MRRAARIVDAHRAARAEHAAFDGEERRDLLEHLPRADALFGGGDRVEIVWQVKREATDETTVGTEQLDGRCDRIRRQAREAPHLEGAIGDGFRSHRARRYRHEIGEAGEQIDLLQALLHQRLDRLPLVECLRAVARLDELGLRAMREIEDVRVKSERGEHEADRQQCEAERLRALPVPAFDPRRTNADDNRERQCEYHRPIGNRRPWKNHDHYARQRPAGDDSQSNAPASSRNPPRQIGGPEEQDDRGKCGRVPDDDADLKGCERGVPRVQREMEEIERSVRNRVREQRVMRESDRQGADSGCQLRGEEASRRRWRVDRAPDMPTAKPPGFEREEEQRDNAAGTPGGHEKVEGRGEKRRQQRRRVGRRGKDLGVGPVSRRREVEEDAAGDDREGDGANRHDISGFPGIPPIQQRATQEQHKDRGGHLRGRRRDPTPMRASLRKVRRRHHRGDQMPGVRAGDVDAVRIRRGADVFEREFE